MIATGITAGGDREVLGLAVGDSEAETFWTEFLRSLRRRGLGGVRLVIIDLGGRLDAYERMFQEEIDPELLQRRIESAEVMNAQTGEHFDEQAMLRTNELLMMLILMESQVR